MKMNKMSIREKSVEAKEIKKFAREEILLMPRYDARPTFKKVFKDITTDSTAYGKSTPTLTPIKSLINGQVGNESCKFYENK